MAGRRHHTIPRFLLKGFASSSRGKATNVWCYRKNAPGLEPNIENVGVERDFYGVEGESDLDEKITALESDYARFVIDLRDGRYGAGPIDDQRIAEFVTHMALRTRSLRQSVTQTTIEMLNEMRKRVMDPEVLRRALRKSFGRAELSRLVREDLSTRGLRPFDIERQLPVLVPKLLPLVDQFIDTYIQDQAPHYHRALEAHIACFPETMRTSFIEKMSEHLESTSRVASYERFNWFVLEPEQSLILGDCACLFETEGKRRFKPLDDNDNPAVSVLLPISSNRLLTGVLTCAPPRLNSKELNRTFAACSLEYFVSSVPRVGQDACLTNLIGSEAGVLSHEERRLIMEDLTSTSFDVDR